MKDMEEEVAPVAAETSLTLGVAAANRRLLNQRPVEEEGELVAREEGTELRGF